MTWQDCASLAIPPGEATDDPIIIHGKVDWLRWRDEAHREADINLIMPQVFIGTREIKDHRVPKLFKAVYTPGTEKGILAFPGF